MDQRLHERLNQIPDKILAQEFLSGQGLGNEISFWIFDYSPEHELHVREYIRFLEDMLVKKHQHLHVININLLQSLVDYLGDRKLLDKAIHMQQTKGDDALLKALKGPLHMDKFAPHLIEKYAATEQDIIFISGIGSVWPLLRAHNLLNSLHSLIGHKPGYLMAFAWFLSPLKHGGQSFPWIGQA